MFVCCVRVLADVKIVFDPIEFSSFFLFFSLSFTVRNEVKCYSSILKPYVMLCACILYIIIMHDGMYIIEGFTLVVCTELT